ncbi:hypothetical protein CK203_093342 [Vitis vinifera]|uniref:WW domain-containing protein n=1 Tax=Vitis vinifera TaxID=29760 RepID=A0A438F7M2_VITVI|nr:hypothetical protein CK203_093342 [Vitis vinifera]
MVPSANQLVMTIRNRASKQSVRLSVLGDWMPSNISQLIEAMVSFQTPLSPDPTRPIVSEFENLSKKRKWEKTGTEEVFKLQSKAKSTKSIFDIELQLETPLPLEWQRCLDIQSGQIHFYNTRTHKRTSRDPRASPEPPSPGPMSLELELNLPCDSLGGTALMTIWESGIQAVPPTIQRNPYRRRIQGGSMLSIVSSPTCPNCKFMHPPDQTPPNLFKRRRGEMGDGRWDINSTFIWCMQEAAD